MRNVDTCRLCRLDQPLCKSHIMPECVYRYDDSHRLAVVTSFREKVSRRETGIWERLLCAECESRMNELETYFARVWSGPKALARQVAFNGRLHVLPGLDYTVFKLFHLSILWRAAVSRREEFQSVRLGPHEEPLRDMLLSGQPGDPNHYAVQAFRLANKEGQEVCDAMVTPPAKNRLEGRTAYKVTFRGCLWIYHVSPPPYPEMAKFFFGRDGVLRMPTIDINECSNFTNVYASRKMKGWL